ncbi:MAG TPA: hypothetical protein VFS67_07755 [Polyangiaceae bacterium]|nr:hypothetical protein [Polyangiaceae bacterium]
MVDARVKRALARRQRARIGVGLFCATLHAACAAQPGPARSPAAANGSAEAPPATGFGAGLRTIEARGQGLAFPLPDPAGWRRDTREQHSWVALHQRSSSRLVVRAWRFDGIPGADGCERQARLWRKDLPQLAPSELVAQSERLLAGAYRARITVGVREAASSTPERLVGSALGFGSDARECLMIAFSTSAAGPGARRVIAERLAAIAGTVFERARRLRIEERVSVPPL